MVSKVPTFSGKLIGQKIAREHVPPVFVLAALFIALLLTYPALTLAVGSVTYLALIPLSAYRYHAEERKAAKTAKAQSGKGQATQEPSAQSRRAGDSPENQAMKQRLSTYLRQLEAESIHIMREVAAEFRNPVMLYSIGKDSSVMLHLALKAFYPGKPPFPLLHVDTTWKFREMIAFRDPEARRLGLDLIVHTNEQGVQDGISPITHGSALYTDIMKTEALKQALAAHGFDAAFGGARRDEEKSRAKERVFSFRNAAQNWDPKRQRPELWHIANTKIGPGESMRVFPLSNWTELDVWTYIYLENIPVVPLYFAADRPVVERGGTLIMVDDERLPLDAEREARDGARALPHARLLSTHRRHPVRGGDGAGNHRGADRHALFGTPGPRHRPRSGRVDGEEEAGGLFLMPRLSVVGGSGQTDAGERVDARIAAEEDRGLLRFLTCGSVDDGKSTLIGRLLYDSHLVFEDQMQSAGHGQRRAGAGRAAPLDLALLIDGLQAEREQKITIDVAYRYFSTPRRKFIVADTPGHVQYTRNMATGASNCDFAVLLVDARSGILTQTRRHACILSLLGIGKVALAVNKMDLVDFDQARFDAIAEDFAAFARQLGFDAGDGHSRFGAQGRQRGDAERAYALVSRADAARASGDGGCRPQRGASGRSAFRCSG